MNRDPHTHSPDVCDTLERLAATQPNLPVPLTAEERDDLRQAVKEMRRLRLLLREAYGELEPDCASRNADGSCGPVCDLRQRIEKALTDV